MGRNIKGQVPRSRNRRVKLRRKKVVMAQQEQACERIQHSRVVATNKDTIRKTASRANGLGLKNLTGDDRRSFLPMQS